MNTHLIPCEFFTGKQHAVKSLALMLALAASLCHPPALAEAPGAAPDQPAWIRYSAGSIQSVEMADRILAELADGRQSVDQDYAERERACAPKFFINNCLVAAAEYRRESRMKLRALEVEANSFKRRQRVIERDREMEEARNKQAAKEAANVPLIVRGEQEHAMPPQGTTPPVPPAPTVVVPEPITKEPIAKARPGLSRSTLETAAGTQRQPTETADDARKRAEKVEAYENKVKKFEARQRVVAAKKLERENQQNARSLNQPKAE